MAHRRKKIKQDQKRRQVVPKAQYSGLRELFRTNGLLDKDGKITAQGREALSN